ncbi:hypothetical protein [Ralstonia pseudosolanacearum]|uniref:hypothetical protein n=1 Tax=Ralstonia pseudosolanacearum TaxID=1310165 RepID=UPI003398C66D
MVRIRQHGANGELFDLNSFFSDIDTLCPAEEWEVSVSECLGDGATEVESLGVSKPSLVTTDHLRAFYRGVYQTIDGEFVGYRGGTECCRLVAVDSSYWEITGSPDFEAAFALKYGLYVPQGV